jgi:hypothetical protein
VEEVDPGTAWIWTSDMASRVSPPTRLYAGPRGTILGRSAAVESHTISRAERSTSGSGTAEGRADQSAHGDLDVDERAPAHASAILVHNSRASCCGSFCSRHSVSIVIVARSAAV